MIDEILKDAEQRMNKTLESLDSAFARIRTGRAHPSILDGVLVSYYGNNTPISQISNIVVEDGRTLLITPWERDIVPDIERAILKSDLGLNPATASENIRLPMPPLTEENRRDLTRVAKTEAENARVAIRNIRRDGNNDVKEFLKEKEITEDDARKGEDLMQKLTDRKIEEVDNRLDRKESDLMEI
ncbi:MAG: ribosome recycling factor [Candidatus Azotimanducaceae bacterium]|uniref:Ribosome-recycling factor n=1 Tax=OM182 bacterium TaxID=2510334 RepID=A0A520S436_9GAMM|nr:ribosome recycling factor [Gammaproteobacteria bacterium]OUV68071.1 MAG: ribosome recycling factor [Gammaproteobacteria bacterium TMED133]RZO77196.1 MAG: ribosome recycling factor [OM182 bacterium]